MSLVGDEKKEIPLAKEQYSSIWKDHPLTPLLEERRENNARQKEKTCLSSRSAQEALSTKEVIILLEPHPTQWPQEQGRMPQVNQGGASTLPLPQKMKKRNAC